MRYHAKLVIVRYQRSMVFAKKREHNHFSFLFHSSANDSIFLSISIAWAGGNRTNRNVVGFHWEVVWCHSVRVSDATFDMRCLICSFQYFVGLKTNVFAFFSLSDKPHDIFGIVIVPMWTRQKTTTQTK